MRNTIYSFIEYVDFNILYFSRIRALSLRAPTHEFTFRTTPLPEGENHAGQLPENCRRFSPFSVIRPKTPVVIPGLTTANLI
jgi:hypothetical protein